VDDIDVYANGVIDQDENYYGIITIGTQTWLSENLNSGSMLLHRYVNESTNNGIVEKYCYDNLESNCDIYGGLYPWTEMMDYGPPDDSIIGITQGICPAGWHIPTHNEWLTLVDYLGGNEVAGGKLKDTSSYWMPPNVGATNESGFTALPGGCLWYTDGLENPMRFEDKGYSSIFSTATQKEIDGVFSEYFWICEGLLEEVYLEIEPVSGSEAAAYSVRCIKNLE